MTFGDAVQILAAFERHGVAYVLVGSLAMAAQGIVRATRDMDAFVDPEEANVARLRAALDEVFRDPEIQQISATDLAGDYPAVRYAPPSGDLLDRHPRAPRIVTPMSSTRWHASKGSRYASQRHVCCTG